MTNQNMTINVQKDNRNGAVDLLRCFGIVLMIMGHVGFGEAFDKYIHAFHMPMWFFITGMFFKIDSDIFHFCHKKAFQLLVPYCSFGFIYELINAIRGGHQWSGMIWPNTIKIPIGGGTLVSTSLVFCKYN